MDQLALRLVGTAASKEAFSEPWEDEGPKGIDRKEEELIRAYKELIRSL